MAFIGEIAAHLKADNSDFKSKMAEAGQATEKLDSQLKKFGLGFGGVAALATIFRAVVDHARDLNGVLDENQARAKQFAADLDGAKKGLLDIGVSALGVVNGLGEWIGRQLSILKHGREQVELAEKIDQQTGETLATLEKQRKITEEANAIRAKAEEIERRTTEENAKQLDIRERLLVAHQNIAAAEDEIRRAGSDKIAAAKGELQLAEARASLQKVELDQAKQIAAEEKVIAEARAKSSERHVDTLQKIQKLQFDALPIEEKILTYQESIKNISELIAQNKAEGIIDDELTLGLLENNLELSRLRKEQAEEQIRAEKGITAEIKTQNEQLRVGFEIRGRTDDALSDRALEDKVRTLSASIQARQQKLFQQGAPDPMTGAGGYDSLLPHELKELAAAQAELEARRNIRAQVSRYGESGASRNYQGNIPEFERLLNFVRDQPDTKRTADVLTEINERLRNSGLFPKR